MSETILIAKSLSEAHELSSDTASGSIPGFIVDSTLLRTSHGSVIELLQQIQPKQFPFDNLHNANTSPRLRYPPHIDCGFDGISVNFYRRGGPVRVELATLHGERPDPRDIFFVGNYLDDEFQTSHMSPSLEALCLRESVQVGQVYSGDISEGCMTVFWAGSDNVNPALHYFNREQTLQTHRQSPLWTRLSSLRTQIGSWRASKDYRREQAEDAIDSMSRIVIETLSTL